MTYNIFDNDAESPILDDNELAQANGAKVEFEAAVLSGDEAETGLTMEFGVYADLMGESVGKVYYVFKEKHPRAETSIGSESNFYRLCDDLEILVDAKIIEPLEEVKHDRAYNKLQTVTATEHGLNVAEKYLTQSPV